MVQGTCKVEGCGRVEQLRRGMCQRDYWRWKTYGSTEKRYYECPKGHKLSPDNIYTDAKGNHCIACRDLREAQSVPQCKRDDCDEPVLARDWCRLHYLRWWRTGSPDDPPPQTVCINGHTLRPETTVFYSGKRYCKFCAADKDGRRRARKAATQSEPVDFAIILAEFGMLCHICDGEIESRADLHMDHVIPLAKGGTHTYDNIRPSHGLCNLRKADKLPA